MRNEIHTINYKGVEFECIGEYDRGEPGYLYSSDGSGLPPTPQSFIIEKVVYRGIDITDLINALIGDDFYVFAEEDILRHRD